MKPVLKHVAASLFAALLLVLLVLLLLAGERAQRKTRLCTGLEVSLPDACAFVSEEDIARFLSRRYGDYVGLPLDSLQLGKIEALLSEKRVVLGSEAWTTDDGLLHIRIRQRMPVLRFQRGEAGFYVDKDGVVFPLHPVYTAPVPVVSGEIPPVEQGGWEPWTSAVMALMARLDGDAQWHAWLGSVSVDSRGELLLRPAEGKEVFYFGPPDEVAEKLAKISRYYTHIIPAKGAGYYKSIHLKFKQQVICRRDI
ncbi:MAG: hypothetical protein J5871_01050 [Bacteroidales bacterium]|nr:hypothetical protein [Bacteroidales bacterium]